MLFGVSPTSIQQPMFPQVTPANAGLASVNTVANFNPGSVFVPASSAAALASNNFGGGNTAAIGQLITTIQSIVAMLGQLLPLLGNAGTGSLPNNTLPTNILPTGGVPAANGNLFGGGIQQPVSGNTSGLPLGLPPLGGNLFGTGAVGVPSTGNLFNTPVTALPVAGQPAVGGVPNQQQSLDGLRSRVTTINSPAGNFTAIKGPAKTTTIQQRELISGESQAVISDNHALGNLLLKGGINNFAANVVGKTEDAVRLGLGLPAGSQIPGGLTMQTLQQAATGLTQQDNNNVAVRDAKRVIQLSMAEGQSTGSISGKLHLTALMDSFDKFADIPRGSANSFVVRYQNEINNLPPPSAGRPLAQSVTAAVGSPEQVAQIKGITGLNDAELAGYINWNHSAAFTGKISDSMFAIAASNPAFMGDTGFTAGNTQLLALALADDGQLAGAGGERSAQKAVFATTVDRLMGRNVAAFDVGAAIKQAQAKSGINDNQLVNLVNQTKTSVASGLGAGVSQAFRNIAEDPASALGMPAIASALSGVCPFLAGSVNSAKNLAGK